MSKLDEMNKELGELRGVVRTLQLEMVQMQKQMMRRVT